MFSLLRCEGFTALLGFSRMVLTTSIWSPPTSVPLYALTSNREVLHFLFIAMWSIWFLVFLSGDIHMYLCISLCKKIVPSMTLLFSSQKAANSSPFSFIVSIPFLAMRSSLPLLPAPTLAFMSSIMISTSCLGIVEVIACSSLSKFSFSSSCAPLVGVLHWMYFESKRANSDLSLVGLQPSYAFSATLSSIRATPAW